MQCLRRPVPPSEALTHKIRTQYRRLHVRRVFYQLPLSTAARGLLEKLALFMDIATFEVDLRDLSVYLYDDPNQSVYALIDELMGIPRLCTQANSSTIIFNEQALVRIGLKVVDSNKLHQEPSAIKMDPKTARILDEAQKVMQGYNAVRVRHYQRLGGFIPSPLKFTRIMRNAAVSVAMFCAAHEITDYELFIECICHDRQWKTFPHLHHCHQEWCYDVYRNRVEEVKGLRSHEERMTEQTEKEAAARESGEKRSILRDMYIGTERIKLNYKRIGEIETCMANIDDSLGFHPKSTVCKECPLADECRDQLMVRVSELTNGLVDVVKLREGTADIAVLQKQLDDKGIGFDLYDGTTNSAQNRIEERLNV